MLEILCLGRKQPTKLIVEPLGKVPKSGALRRNKLSEGNLLLLNGAKGFLEVEIVRRVWLRGRIRSGLTRSRDWMMRCRSNNPLITRHLIKVTSVKKGGAISIGKWQKSIPWVSPT